MEARDSVYDGKRPFLNFEVIRIFQIFKLCILLASEVGQKKKIRKKKQPVDPLSYQLNIHTRPHLWQIPQKMFGLIWVKSCNFRQNNMEMELSWKPGIVCMTGKGLTLFLTWK